MRAYCLMLAFSQWLPVGAAESALPVGMRWRAPPASASAGWAPAVIREAPTNETCLLSRTDGTLEIYAIGKPASDVVTVIRSHDGGLTWSETQTAFVLPGKAYYAIQVLAATDGVLHAVMHILGEGPGGYRGRLYEVYHATLVSGASAWSSPRRIVPGYVGSIRGFIQLRQSGRLVLAVARAVPEREKAPASGPDLGWNDTFVYISDDAGRSWQESPDRLSLELKTTNVTRYGAIEPVLLELRDQRVWMLVRDRGGRLWQSWSDDRAAHWPALARSGFISSDSPAALLRLKNGKIVLFTNMCQNGSDPRSYAMGGREILHAAISADDGETWRGFREVLHEPLGASRGDRGTAYASAAENAIGKVVFVSGQGEGKRAIVTFDPAWLEESVVRDELAAGPSGWTHYGAPGLRVETLGSGPRAVAMPLPAAGLGGALWNFPLGAAGEVSFRIQVPAEARSVRLALNDHFNRIDDVAAAERAVFALTVDQLADAGWHDVHLTWRDATANGAWQVAIDGQPPRELPAQRPAQFGVNYLRIEFRATSAQGWVRLSALVARVP